MTQQVRDSYRSHRKATWGIVLALAVAITAVAIPFASASIADNDDDDDSKKTYTLGFSSGSFLAKTVCTDAGSVGLVLKNTSSRTLGSAEIKFPSFAVVASSGLAVSPSGTASLVSGNKVRLLNLGLTKNASVTITVPFSSLSSGGSEKLVTVVKKNANFSGDTFKTAPAPTLKVMGCASISGQVFKDWNRNGVFDATGTPPDSALAGWQVRLFKVGTSQPLATVPTGAGGDYTFTGVATGTDKNYRLCVKAPTGGNQAWALQAPTGNTNCDPISPPSDRSAAHALPGLSGSATDKHFAVVPVTAPVPCGGQSEVDGYLVQLGNNASAPTSTANCDKVTSSRFVQDSVFDSATGKFYFLFTPAPGSGTGEVLLVERLTAEFDLAKLQTTVLTYDDVAPFDTYVTMPGCDVDPRANPLTDKLTLKPNLDESTILPGSHTSCLMETGEAVGPTPGKFTRTDYVFTSVDGGRGMG